MTGRGRGSGRAIGVVAALLTGAAAPACAQQGGDDAEIRRLRGGERWATDFRRASVPLEEIVSGGPPKDGIPAIDDPRFTPAEEADAWLEDRDPVIVVEHGDEVKGYPLAILIWHEIVNDEVGGRPVAVTFCPLCNTALVFDRRVAGRTLDFGTTGRLRHSDLVMYDRRTETWWQQATGEAIVGDLVGERLELVAANTYGWERARRLFPGIRVLSRRTGHARDYGRNPYRRYDSRRGPFARFFQGDADPRLPAMERVVAIDEGRGWAASFEALGRERVAHDELDGRPIVVFWAGGAASALDRGRIAEGRDVGQTAVFDRRVGDRTLRFEAADEGFRDRETGSRWNLAGRAVAGPLRGERLRPIPHGTHFWFAWVVFRPETEVWPGG